MIEDDAALVATVTYFRALRREWAGRTGKPLDQCPVPDWSAIAPLDRMSFVRCMKSSLIAAKPHNVISTIERVRAL